MKKLYAILFIMCLCLSAHAAKGTLYVGYPIDYDYIYSYDGFGGLDKDTKIGAAILVTRDMVAPYIGANIKGLRIGWADPTASTKATTFARTELNGEDLAAGTGTLYDRNNGSWNTVNFKTPITIAEDFDHIYVGYQCTLKAGSWGVSNMYPHNQAGSAFLSREGVNDESGQLLWEDLSESGTLSIQLIVEGETSEYGNIASLQNLRRYPIATQGETSDGLLTLCNEGMSSINSLTLTYTLGEKSEEKTIPLKTAILKGKKANIAVPVCNLGTGEHSVSITKVNDADNRLKGTITYYQTAVPADVAERYTRRPLVEWIESENAWNCVKYYDDYLAPGIDSYRDRMSLLSCHFEDQFMTGDDEELEMLLHLCDKDSSKIYVPTFMIDRTQMVTYSSDAICNYAPWAQGVVMPQFVGPLYEAALELPTFASVTAEIDYDEQTLKGQITVSGEVAENILAESDELGLVVVLVEDKVDSDSQLIDEVKQDDKKDDKKVRRKGDDDGSQVYGHVTHNNVGRYRLTPLYGDVITEEGTYSKTYDFELEEDWKVQDMRVLAYLTLNPQKNGKWRGNVINSTEQAFPTPEGIRTTTLSSTTGRAYDLQGRQLQGHAAKGIMIRNGQKIIY